MINMKGRAAARTGEGNGNSAGSKRPNFAVQADVIHRPEWWSHGRATSIHGEAACRYESA